LLLRFLFVLRMFLCGVSTRLNWFVEDDTIDNGRKPIILLCCNMKKQLLDGTSCSNDCCLIAPAYRDELMKGEATGWFLSVVMNIRVMGMLTAARGRLLNKEENIFAST